MAGSGEPPHFDNRAGHKHFSYFENEHGEQWIFVYDYETESGLLQGGDAGWHQRFKVVDGATPGLILNSEERQWLFACWKAATAFKEGRQRRRDQP